jgi:hypothetical protein
LLEETKDNVKSGKTSHFCMVRRLNIFKMIILPNYNLDLECPSKAHVLKAWSQTALLEGGRTFKRWACVGGFRSLGECPQRGLWDWRFFLFLLFFTSWR